ANLLAVPAAGPVMMWGLAAGLPAGLVGGAVARVVHLPTAALVGWIALVARRAAAAPLGELHAPQLAGVAAGVALFVLARRRSRLLTAIAAAGVAISLVVPGLAVVRSRDLHGRQLAPGARVWRAGSVTVVDVDDASSAALLAGVRHLGVRRLDLLVVEGPGRAAAAAVEPLLRRVPPRRVLVAAGTPIARAVVPDDDTELTVGPFVVSVDGVRPRLRVAVEVGPR